MTAAVALPLLIGGASLAASTVLRPTPKKIAPVPTPTKNQAEEAAIASDRLARRRGTAANLLLGASGAESSTGTKTTLGS